MPVFIGESPASSSLNYCIVLFVCIAINSVACLHGNASSASSTSSSSAVTVRYRARVGRIFIAKIVGSEFSPTTDDNKQLPNWLHRRSDSDLIEGVPLDRNTGEKLYLPAAGFVEVLPRASGSAFGNTSVSGGGGCSRRPPTVAAVLIDLDPESAKPERLAALLRNLSAKLQVKISTLEVSPDAPSSHHHQRQYLLASGPGNANIRRSVQAARVTWQVGCGSIDSRHLKALERLERLAMTGELTPEPVLLWFVADLIYDADLSTSDSSGASRLRRSAAANLYSGRRRSEYATSMFLADSAAVPASVSESSGLASPPLPTRESRPTPPAATHRIELPTRRPAVPPVATTTTAAATTPEPGIRQLFQMSAEPYSFPVGVLTRILLMPNAGRDSLLADLKTDVTGCGHKNSLGVFGRYYPGQMVLEGHPTAKDIGSQHKCSLHVTDSRGKQDFFGFTIRVPEPTPPEPLPSASTDSRLFSLLLGIRYNRPVDPADYFVHASAHDIRVCVTPISNRCASFQLDSPLQFDQQTNRVYGLAWRRNQLTSVPRMVYLLATSKYNKTAVLTSGYTVTEPRIEDSSHQNKINHQYKLHVESEIDYLRQLETETAALYNIIGKIGDYLEGGNNNNINNNNRQPQIQPAIHLKWLNRTDSRSRSMVLIFGCIINYGRRYCPRMSIIDVAKKMFRYCVVSQPDGQPWPDFAAALAPRLTPVQLITTPLGTCTSGSYQFPMRFYLAPAAACPSNDDLDEALTTRPVQPPLRPLAPPTLAPPNSGSSSRSGLRVNYVTTKEHGVYCLLPFSISVGSSFSRPVKRLGCVNDSRGNDLSTLPLQLCTYASDDGNVCINANKFIVWNASKRGFEGIPFDADFGPKHFVVLVRSSLFPAETPVRFNLSVGVEQPQWGPFRCHRVRMRIEVDRYRVSNPASQYKFFRQLNDLVSSALSGNQVYMRLPPDDLKGQLRLPASVVNFTVDWTVVGYDSDGAVIDGFRKYKIYCPVDQLVLLRRVATNKLSIMLKSNSIVMQTLLFILEGNCSGSNYGDLFRLYDNYMQSRHPANNVVTRYPPSLYPGGNEGSNNGASNSIENAAVGDSNVLLITVAPACGLVLLALLVALLVACCLYRRKPANGRGGQQQQQQQQRSRHVSYQQQQQPLQQQQQQQQYHNASMSRHGDFSLTSKHVPIIFAEELEERPSAPSKPLILPNEKPPLPPPDVDGYDQEELMMERTPLNHQQQQQLLLMQQQQQQFATLGRTNGHGMNGGNSGGSGVYRTLPNHQQQQQHQQHLYQQQNPGVYGDRLQYSNQG